MPCPCSQSSVVPAAEPVLETVVPLSAFKTTGSLKITNTGNAFIDLATVIPFAISAINAYITSLAVAQNSTDPTFLNVPYLYSLSKNLVLGNYLESIVRDGIFVTTTYFVPYQGDSKIETAVIITILNLETKILFFQIPNQFSYNSLQLAAVATVPTGACDYHAQFQIPQSFVNKTIFGSAITVDVDIAIPPIKPSIEPNSENDLGTVEVVATGSCDLSSRQSRSNCEDLSETTCADYKRCTNIKLENGYLYTRYDACKWDDSKCIGDESCSQYVDDGGCQ